MRPEEDSSVWFFQAALVVVAIFCGKALLWPSKGRRKSRFDDQETLAETLTRALAQLRGAIPFLASPVDDEDWALEDKAATASARQQSSKAATKGGSKKKSRGAAEVAAEPGVIDGQAGKVLASGAAAASAAEEDAAGAPSRAKKEQAALQQQKETVLEAPAATKAAAGAPSALSGDAQSTVSDGREEVAPLSGNGPACSSSSAPPRPLPPGATVLHDVRPGKASQEALAALEQLCSREFQELHALGLWNIVSKKNRLKVSACFRNEATDEALGFVVYRVQPHITQVLYLGVAADERKQGVGRGLLDAVAKLAREMSSSLAGLVWVASSQEDTLPFWRGSGFQRCYPGGFEKDQVFLKCELRKLQKGDRRLLDRCLNGVDESLKVLSWPEVLSEARSAVEAAAAKARLAAEPSVPQHEDDVPAKEAEESTEEAVPSTSAVTTSSEMEARASPDEDEDVEVEEEPDVLDAALGGQPGAEDAGADDDGVVEDAQEDAGKASEASGAGDEAQQPWWIRHSVIPGGDGGEIEEEGSAAAFTEEQQNMFGIDARGNVLDPEVLDAKLLRVTELRRSVNIQELSLSELDMSCGPGSGSDVVHLKGFDYGLGEVCDEEILEFLLEHFSVVVWDGDDYDDSSFTRFIPKFLSAKATAKAIACKFDYMVDSFRESWAPFLNEFGDRMAVVPVNLRRPGFEDAVAAGVIGDLDRVQDLPVWAEEYFLLSRLLQKVSRVTHVVAIGGDSLVAKEAAVSVESGVGWTVYALSRGRQERLPSLMDWALSEPTARLIRGRDPHELLSFAAEEPACSHDDADVDPAEEVAGDQEEAKEETSEVAFAEAAQPGTGSGAPAEVASHAPPEAAGPAPASQSGGGTSRVRRRRMEPAWKPSLRHMA
eukprot:TRINITY_DN45186_c0_g1_i1.p1 TRINITY_DN45186_c0_g1~~TRINITY_DN45186_c0_g1_i1.p1  ORF type:complete len:887 (-),score=296.09 TRINITY_DN45186_c0_g1_i1:74-2734(-)